MKRTCIICKEKFNLSKEEIRLINDGEISSTDIRICDECADSAYQIAEQEDYLNTYQFSLS
jgi:hypothetical protein